VLTLSPGTYTITKALNVSDSAKLQGDGVTLYFAPKAGIHFAGASYVNLTAPKSGDYDGVSIFFDRNDTAAFTSDGAPTPANPDQRTINGAIYALSAPFNIEELAAHGRMVLNTLNVPGGGWLAVSTP
jgi:hypothetical protein